MMSWGRAKVVEVFGADLRSLAVFRMALAVMVLVDLAYRATDLSVFYTDGGVLPRGVLVRDELVLDRWRFSLNLLSGEPFFQGLLFGAAAMAALALLAGYHTRPMTVILWVLMVSIQWRNPLVTNEGDTLLRVLLFWLSSCRSGRTGRPIARPGPLRRGCLRASCRSPRPACCCRSPSFTGSPPY